MRALTSDGAVLTSQSGARNGLATHGKIREAKQSSQLGQQLTEHVSCVDVMLYRVRLGRGVDIVYVEASPSGHQKRIARHLSTCNMCNTSI